MKVASRRRVTARPWMFRATSVLSFGNMAVATGRVDADERRPEEVGVGTRHIWEGEVVQLTV